MRPVSLQGTLVLAVMLGAAWAQTPAKTTTAAGAKTAATTAAKTYPPEMVERGKALFRQDCSFCHGRNAGGGETGPDLTRSELVTTDVGGNKIGPVVRMGRPDKGMPPFDRTPEQIASLVAFIHTQQNVAAAQKGGRKGVDPSDLQTGNADAGKQYFNGAGGCAGCHSPTGDLAGVASRYKGLRLEMQMLYPRHAKSKVTVTPKSGGDAVSGQLAYQDEFTVGLVDASGRYRSWRTSDVEFKVDAPVHAHVDLFNKYTDDDIHNLMAYLQTLQ